MCHFQIGARAIGLDRLPESDGQLLRSICHNPLRCTQNKRIRKPLLNYLPDKFLRIENPLIHNDQHSFHIPNLLNELFQLAV